MTEELLKKKMEIYEAIRKLTQEQVKDFIGEGFLGVLICPKCKKITVRPVTFDDYYNKAEGPGHHLHICSCASGGVYKTYFECPECNYEVELDGMSE